MEKNNEYVRISSEDTNLFKSMLEIALKVNSDEKSRFHETLRISFPMYAADPLHESMPKSLDFRDQFKYKLILTKEMMENDSGSSVLYSFNTILGKEKEKTKVYFTEKTGLLILKFQQWLETKRIKKELDAELSFLVGDLNIPGRQKLENPDTYLGGIWKDLRTIQIEKNRYVRNQNYEEAIECRNQEKEKVSQIIEHLKTTYPDNELFKNDLLEDAFISFQS